MLRRAGKSLWPSNLARQLFEGNLESSFNIRSVSESVGSRLNNGATACSLPLPQGWGISRAYGSIVPFHLAQTGEGIKECELLQWYKKEGEAKGWRQGDLLQGQ